MKLSNGYLYCSFYSLKVNKNPTIPNLLLWVVAFGYNGLVINKEGVIILKFTCYKIRYDKNKEDILEAY